MIHDFHPSIALARRFLEESRAQRCLQENLPPLLKAMKGESWRLPVDWRWAKELIVHFDEIYPDVPPRIFLAYLEPGVLIPHVNARLFVCTLRRDTVVNPDKAADVLKECLDIARSVLDREWTPSDIQEHVASELSAYWQSDEVRPHQILFDPELLRQKCHRVDPLIAEAKLFKASSIESEKPFNVDSSGIGITIDFAEQDVVPLVSQKGEYIASAETAVAAIEEFSRVMPRPVRSLKRVNIYFAFRCSLRSGHRVLYGRLQEKLLLKTKSPAQIVTAILDDLRGQRLIACKAEDISHERLIRRSAGSQASGVSEFRIAIVGCGSLGSFLVDALSRAGIRSFLLCDDEYIEAGNIARHTSPLLLIGQRKTLAVSLKIRERFEDLSIIECRRDFREPEALSEIEAFDPHLTVFATGDTNTDLTASRLVSEGKIGAACFVWGEAGLSAGHMIIQARNTRSLLMDLHSKDGDEGNYAHRVERLFQDSLEQEAGCPTIYSPYAGHDMALFATIAAKRVIKWLLDANNESCVLRLRLKDMQPWEVIHA